MPVNAEKDALRKTYLQYRRSLSVQEKTLMDALIVSRVLLTDAYLAAQTVFCYISLPQEINTMPILWDAWRRGKRIAAPRCRMSGRMEFYAITSSDDLSPGMLGIMEPKESCPLCEPALTDVCIVPCLAADDRGFRLGYGGGYYDRYLSVHSVQTIGLCYSACRTRVLPTGPYDVSIQMLVSDKEV